MSIKLYLPIGLLAMGKMIDIDGFMGKITATSEKEVKVKWSSIPEGGDQTQVGKVSAIDPEQPCESLLADRPKQLLKDTEDGEFVLHGTLVIQVVANLDDDKTQCELLSPLPEGNAMELVQGEQYAWPNETRVMPLTAEEAGAIVDQQIEALTGSEEEPEGDESEITNEEEPGEEEPGEEEEAIDEGPNIKDFMDLSLADEELGFPVKLRRTLASLYKILEEELTGAHVLAYTWDEIFGKNGMMGGGRNNGQGVLTELAGNYGISPEMFGNLQAEMESLSGEGDEGDAEEPAQEIDIDGFLAMPLQRVLKPKDTKVLCDALGVPHLKITMREIAGYDFDTLCEYVEANKLVELLTAATELYGVTADMLGGELFTANEPGDEEPTEEEEPVDESEITGTRYWIHPESDSLFTTENGEQAESDGLVEEVTEERYMELLAEKESAQDELEEIDFDSFSGVEPGDALETVVAMFNVVVRRLKAAEAALEDLYNK